MIPVEFSTAGTPRESVHVDVLSAREAIVFLDNVDTTEWVKLNPGSFGFYRVQYSSEMLQMLKPAISDCSLPPIDRLGLLDDLFALVSVVCIVKKWNLFCIYGIFNIFQFVS